MTKTPNVFTKIEIVDELTKTLEWFVEEFDVLCKMAKERQDKFKELASELKRDIEFDEKYGHKYPHGLS